MNRAHSVESRWSRTGDIARVALGTLIVIAIGYLGIVLAPTLGLSYFWPYAGIWAAIGWGAGRMSMKPVLALIITGLIMDLSVDGPIGCWPAIHLVTYLTATLFRRRAQTDRTGLVRTLGDITAFIVAFFTARWVMGGYLGEMETQNILGGFLSTALLFLPVRGIFLLKRSEWMES